MLFSRIATKKALTYVSQRFKWYQRELNQRHTDFQSVALPTELWYPFSFALQKYNNF